MLKWENFHLKNFSWYDLEKLIQTMAEVKLNYVATYDCVTDFEIYDFKGNQKNLDILGTKHFFKWKN